MDFFQRHTSNGIEPFSLLIRRYDSKFVLLSVLKSHKDDLAKPFGQNYCPRMKTFHVRLTCVAVKRLKYATRRERKEDGKPCVTNVAIILFEITFR